MLSTKYAWPALASALLVMGCVQLQGSPAMRPHAARVAADSDAPDAATLAAATPARDEPAPTAATSAADPGVADTVAAAGVSHATYMPPAAESAGWGSGTADTFANGGIAPVGWLYPLSGFTAASIIGRFGDPRDGGRRSHEGLDIEAARGTPVFAPVPGVIIASGRRGLAGNLVILLDELEGREFFFAHLDSRTVQRGDRVRAGQELGTVGTTGNAAGTTPHLHFEVREAAGPVDPYPLLVGGQ